MSERVEFNPHIAVLAGPPYSGKTTLGLELSRRTNLSFIDINTLRWLFPAGGGEFQSPFLRSSAMAETYQLAHFRAAQHLELGEPVLLAATYSHDSYINTLRAFSDLYRRLSGSEVSALRIFVLEAPEESLADRETSRVRMNDEELFPHIPLQTAINLRRTFVPIIGDDVVHINTGLPLEENVTQVLAELNSFKR